MLIVSPVLTQGTMAFEILEQVPDADAILIPASGGGMSAGISVAAKALKPDIKSAYVMIDTIAELA